MCDTLVATPSATVDGSTILGKNSDREPNEAQTVSYVPGRSHDAGSMVPCTYISIPQAPQTYAVLLSRPYWMFGAEMGVNEHGVAIGNEAVFTKEKVAKTGLTGMDLLRLALERSVSSNEAVEAIISLLETHGQGGDGGMDHKLYYHNSFIVADAQDSFLLETAGRSWAVRRIEGTGSISNALSIEKSFDTCSQANEFSKAGFSALHSNRLFSWASGAYKRQALSGSLLRANEGRISPGMMMGFLRTHGPNGPLPKGLFPLDGLCLHAGGYPSTQTTGSMVAVMKKGRAPLVYFTGTSAPCLSVFKPVYVAPSMDQEDFPEMSIQDNEETAVFGRNGQAFEPTSLWWAWEKLHRKVLVNFPELSQGIVEERDSLESRMLEEMESAWIGENLDDLSAMCKVWTDKLCGWQMDKARDLGSMDSEVKDLRPWWLRMQWKRENTKVNISS